MHGRVLDIGGKKVRPRGKFRPPLQAVDHWEYLNIDRSTEPDYCCDAESMLIPSERFDCFLLIEVLEHVMSPEKVISEAHRVLKHGGHGYVAMPFMYPVHADPHDYQRWTSERLTREFVQAGFSEIKIEPMGGAFSVIFDVLWTLSWRTENVLARRLGLFVLRLIKPLALLADRVMPGMSSYVTTGWGLTARK
jgi:SAM-dependent methyltransferase